MKLLVYLCSHIFLFVLKVGLQDFEFEFCQLNLSRITDKLAVNW